VNKHSLTTNNHRPISWVFADATARAVATNPTTGVAYVTADLYKDCLQLDTLKKYTLTAVTPTWTNAIPNPTDLTIASQARGDILYFNGTNWIRLAKGTATYVLTMGANDPGWSAPSGGATTLPFTVIIPGTAYVADNIVWFRAPWAMTLDIVRVGMITAPTGTGATKPKIMYHSTAPGSAATIFTSETNAPSLAAAAVTADSGDPSTTAIAEDGFIGIGYSAVCATTPGTYLIVKFIPA